MTLVKEREIILNFCNIQNQTNTNNLYKLSKETKKFLLKIVNYMLLKNRGNVDLAKKFNLILGFKNTLQKILGQYSNKRWNWGKEGLSNNPNITPKFVEKHPYKPWDWGNQGLSSNPSITPEFVEKHLDKPWNWGNQGLSSNPSITLEFVKKHLNKRWYWGTYGLSSKPRDRKSVV